jgi:sigma-B regulation protein RsbU (phosphoserine phosphatase)
MDTKQSACKSVAGTWSRLTRFFFHGRVGQVFLALLLLRLLRPTGVLPGAANQLVDLGLVVCGIWFAMRGISALRTRILWRIRRKLIISYLLIGLVPTLLILSFFMLSGLLVFGQVSSYILAAHLERTQAMTARVADLAAAEIAGAGPEHSSIETVLRSRLAPLESHYKGAAAVYVSPDAHVSVGASSELSTDLATAWAELLPEWAGRGYEGLLRLDERYLLVGFSEPLEGETPFRVLVTIPIESALKHVEEETGLQASGVSTTGADETISLDDMSPSPDSPFSMRWATIIEARPWTGETIDAPGTDSESAGIILIRFSPWGVYRVLSTNTPQLGQAILALLGVLAGLFLAIEVVAALVGLLLARSITGSIHALSRGTDHVRQGDFTHRVQVRTRDQLGELAESFNLMTASIQDLLKQSAEKERLEEELRVARSIQMSLLPKDAVRIPGMTVAAVCLPAAEVGGDYYDFIPLGDERLAVLIADVSGKGTSAALYMAELKGLVLSLSRIHDSPRSLLVEANRILGANMDSRSFITMSYAIFDMGKRTMTYARAGHSPILQVSTSGQGARSLAPDGLGLGLDRGDHQFEQILRQESLALQSGDLFLFFTDGLSEAMNSRSELYGESRLRTLLEVHRQLPLENLVERIVDEIVTFAEGMGQHDDMTMVLLRVT